MNADRFEFRVYRQLRQRLNADLVILRQAEAFEQFDIPRFRGNAKALAPTKRIFPAA